MISTATRVLKNTGWLYAKMGITSVISLVTTRLILNSLGQSDFGIYNVVGGAIAMLGFINAAMSSTTQRFLNYSEGEGNPEKQKSIFNVSIVLHMGIAALMILVLSIAGVVFFRGVLNIPVARVEAAKIVYFCLVFSTAITICSAPIDAVLTSHENMKYYAFVGVIESVLKLVVAIACIYTSKDRLILFGILMALIPVISLLIMWVYCFRHYAECVFAPQYYFSKKYIKEMGSFAGWSFAMTSTSMISQYGIGLVLNSFFGVLLNAALGVANQLSGMLSSVSAMAQKAYHPVLFKSEGAGERSRVCYVSLFGCRISFYLFGLFAVPAFLLMPELLLLWLKEVPEWAVVFSRLMLLRIMLEQLFSGLKSAVLASGKIKGFASFSSIIYILPILVLIILFKLGFSPVWLFIVWITCWSVFGCIISCYYASKNVGIRIADYLIIVLLPACFVLLLSVIPFIVAVLFDVPAFVKYVSVILQVVAFLITGWMFLLNRAERQNLVHILRMIVRKSVDSKDEIICS